jgi:hypothetical protein
VEEIHVEILLGIGFFLLYVLVLQPLILRILYPPVRDTAGRRGTREKVLLGLACLALLLLPLMVPEEIKVVRLFYAMMAVTTIQKVVSYVKEGGGTAPSHGGREEYLYFMNGPTTNFTERPGPLSEGEETPDPGRLRLRALAKLAVPAIVIVLNVKLGLWRYTPPLLATAVKGLLFIVGLSAQQDLVHAGLIRKGLRPDVVILDRRLFRIETFSGSLLRANPTTHQWLFRYVYLPLGGKMHRSRSVLASYVLSGLWHEYMLSIASMEIRGLWFAYFTLNGLFVLADDRIKPCRQALFRKAGEGAAPFRVLRIAFLVGYGFIQLCLAHLFMLGLGQVVRFH